MLQIVLGVIAVFLFGLAVRLALIGRAKWDRRLIAMLGSALGLGLIASGRVVSGLVVGAIAALFALAPEARYTPPKPRKRQQDPEVAKARQTLGVGAGATEADIRAAYRQRIATAHPDQGGTSEAVAKLTAARDLLLQRLKRRASTN
jgi:hypothetical protein